MQRNKFLLCWLSSVHGRYGPRELRHFVRSVEFVRSYSRSSDPKHGHKYPNSITALGCFVIRRTQMFVKRCNRGFNLPLNLL